MASSSQPKVLAFKADAAITKGWAVKAGATDNAYVQKCTAKTDKSIGIAQNTVTTAGDKVEVAVNGGGGKALLGGSVSMGDKLAPTTDGSLIATTTEDDTVCAIAMQDGVTGDLIGVEIAVSGGGA